MRDKPKASPREKIARAKRKPLAEVMAERQSLTSPGYDKKKTERTTRQANQAADRLMREMDAFIKQAGRKT